MTIEQIAENKTAQIQAIIKSHIAIGAKGKNGSVNLIKVGEAAGLQNVGHILSRKGVSLNTIFRVVSALNTLLTDDKKENLKSQLSEVWS